MEEDIIHDTSWGTYDDDDGEKVDPQEKDPKTRNIIRQAEDEAVEKIRKESPELEGVLGYCQVLWVEQKQILKEKYNIDWNTPAEMNPDIMYD